MNPPYKFKPFKHQAEALELSQGAKLFALLMEMGTGKTKVVIDSAAYQFHTMKAIDGLLVIAPKSICANWAHKEIPAHLSDACPRRIVLWGPNSMKLDKALGTIATGNPAELHIFVMNVDALGTDRGYKAVEQFLRTHKAMFVIDESTTIKNPFAIRTKRALKLGTLAVARRIMTGTPVTQSPLDIYAQFAFLEPAILQSSTYYGFRNQYAVLRKRHVNGRSFDEVIGYQRLNQLQELIKPCSFRALKRDCLDLPEKVYITRQVEPSPAQRRYYNEIKENAIAMLDNGTLVAAPLVITQLLRLRQALCNIAPTGEDNSATTIDDKNPRLDAVLELLQEAGEQKVIIWANFVHSIKLLRDGIAKEFGSSRVGYIAGDVPALKRQELVDSFQDKDNPLKYLIIQPRTGGHGLTLTAATLVIYHDNDWSLEVRLQSEDRAHRIGQTNKVTYIDLIAPDTVDEKILAALLDKKDIADKITGDKLRSLLV